MAKKKSKEIPEDEEEISLEIIEELGGTKVMSVSEVSSGILRLVVLWPVWDLDLSCKILVEGMKLWYYRPILGYFCD